MTDDQANLPTITEAEAFAVLELLEDQAVEFINNPYTLELAAALKKLRQLAGPSALGLRYPQETE